jgi:hypothetical protein
LAIASGELADCPGPSFQLSEGVWVSLKYTKIGPCGWSIHPFGKKSY